MEHCDVAVWGLGAMGSATAYQLARRGVRVIGLDRHTPPHVLGSTHGESRVTRQAIGEGLAYVPLARRSHHLWREIEAQTGAELFTSNGLLVIASPGSHERHHGKTRFLETTIEAARSFAIDHEVLDAAQITRRFPQFHLRGDEGGYFEPGGGFVRPEAGVAAQLELARRHGADIRTDEAVLAYSEESGGVTLTTARGTLHAGTVVLAPGAWLPSILGEPLARLFAVSRQVLCWFAVNGPPEAFTPQRLPAFIWDSGPTSFYGIPAVDGPSGGVKVGVENSVPVTVGEVVRTVADEEKRQLHDVIAERMPSLAPRCLRAMTCMYTTTPDGDFVIDRHPEHHSVLIISACSGHGFKHSPAIGEAVAALVTGEQPAIDISPFSLQRFRSPSEAQARPR